MSETWFLTSGYRERIKAIQVERSTADSVWIDGRRRARATDYGSYHPTWQEAKDALLAAAEAKVAHARNRLQYANDELGHIKGLKP